MAGSIDSDVGVGPSHVPGDEPDVLGVAGAGEDRRLIPFCAIVACARCLWPMRFGRGYWHAKKPYRNAYNQMVAGTCVYCRTCHLREDGDPGVPQIDGSPWRERPGVIVRDADSNLSPSRLPAEQRLCPECERYCIADHIPCRGCQWDAMRPVASRNE